MHFLINVTPHLLSGDFTWTIWGSSNRNWTLIIMRITGINKLIESSSDRSERVNWISTQEHVKIREKILKNTDPIRESWKLVENSYRMNQTTSNEKIPSRGWKRFLRVNYTLWKVDTLSKKNLTNIRIIYFHYPRLQDFIINFHWVWIIQLINGDTFITSTDILPEENRSLQT